MILHLNKQLFRDAITATAQQLDILPIYVEKDYWVTYALHTIFNNEIGKETIFKGGTALLKCFNLINRFSEDIDLVVLRREGETDAKLKTKIRTICKVVETHLPEVEIEGLTHKMGMNRKTAYSFTKEFQGVYGQIRDVIVIEATWLGYYEPYTTQMLSSFIGDMILKNGQTSIAEENGMLPFEVRVLEPIRTLCEKIMSLVRFSYSKTPIENLKIKIRHTYDLHQLLQQKEFSDFLNSPAFDQMLLKVANDDVISFRNNNQWLNYHPKEALIFSDLENIWNELKTTYNGEFKELLFGDVPSSEDIRKTLTLIKERLTLINWTINVEIKK
jgi:hypothetical protein